MEKLSEKQVSQFINEGFVKVENAFSVDIANKCRAILWEATRCDPTDPASWTQPTIRIGELGHEPFRNAAKHKELTS